MLKKILSATQDYRQCTKIIPARMLGEGLTATPSWAQAMTRDRKFKDDKRAVTIALIALVASIASAYYTYDQADIANRALTEVQRAFIVVDDIQLEKTNSTNGDTFSVNIKIKNSGATPTKNLSYFIPRGGAPFFGQIPPKSNDVGLPNVPNDPAFIFYAGGINDLSRSFAVVGPQGRLLLDPIDFDHVMTSFRAHKEQLKLEKAAIVGAIIYNDIFPRSQRHITKFCYFIYPDTGKTDECGFWNCTDNECIRDSEAYNDALRASYKTAGKDIPKAMLARMDWLQKVEP
ncbi:MAG TPA: hypothetical protein VEH76_09810 [Methylocystis sp.]|nr:hypothetical protein [Methylocystis sp.]